MHGGRSLASAGKPAFSHVDDLPGPTADAPSLSPHLDL